MGTNDTQLVLRLPKDLIKRATKLAKELSIKKEYVGLRLTQAAVVRIAMELGLSELEKKEREPTVLTRVSGTRRKEG